MLATTAASTWGVTDPQFLYGYGALCALGAIGVWYERRRVLGPAPTSRDPQPDLDAYRLALLSGGPDHAITVAAAQLLRDGRLRGDGVTLSANGEPAATAAALEREVFEAVRREPGLAVEEMHARVRDSATMTAMTEQLTRSGLLVGGSDALRMRLSWIVPALLAAVGLARILAGPDENDGLLVALVAAAVVASVRLVGARPLATNRGRSVLERRRSDLAPTRLYPAASEIGLMTALFGGGALWVADPVTASALHVPREKDPGSSGGGGGGGWFGDGGWFGGGSFGDGGGGGGGWFGDGGGGGGGGGCGGGGGGGG